jgi:hypothetical protein
VPRRASEVESGPEGSNGVDLSEGKRLAWINSCTGYELQLSDGYLHACLLDRCCTYVNVDMSEGLLFTLALWQPERREGGSSAL